ncbi:hypothetical protein [Cupriavidus sp. DL-D2]|uniref:hypothetical protein n=1 Tax=Cupriavidus sp. DL-D2 TaxID=3144974 RepID=UPI003213D498
MLTDAQMVDARRFAGYSLVGDTLVDDRSDLAWGVVGPIQWQTLDHRLRNLSLPEETVMAEFLTTLKGLEKAITDSSDNLDTDQAAVWKHNPNEVRDRTKLYNQHRRSMCGFLGIPPGPALGDGVARIGRA